MYNLNDNAFDAKEVSAIFNNGEAGLVENVTINISKKKAEDKENAPDYKLTFKDAGGAEVSSSYWYVKQATNYATVEELVKKQGTAMKHVIHAIYGKGFQIPVNATTPEQLLDQSMKVIRDGITANPATTYRVFATYGTLTSTKEYIQPRSWVPFIENMEVPIEETVLKLSPKVDAIVRPVKDDVKAEPTALAKANSILEGDEW